MNSTSRSAASWSPSISQPTNTGEPNAQTAIAFPGKAELLSCLPEELYRIHPIKTWGSLALSLGLSLLAYGLGTTIPLSPIAAPLWLLYAVVTGHRGGRLLGACA